MAEVYERDPGPLSDDSAELRMLVVGAGDSESLAYELMTAYAPAVYYHPNGAVLPLAGGVEIDEYQGGGLWYGTAKYSAKSGEQSSNNENQEPPPPPANNEAIGGGLTFNTTGGTIHNTLSLETRQSVAAGGGAVPDNKLAVGVHGDSDQIDGYDVVAPKLEFTIKRTFPPMTPAYMQVLRDLTGTVNNAKFMRFEAGEVLFLGASGDDDGRKCEITFTFAVSKNEASVDMGNGMTLTNKKGWNYVWASYSPAVSNNALARQPIFAFLERVYEETDFTQLKIYGVG